MTDNNSVMQRLTNYISAGASVPIAVDVLMVVDCGMSPAAWAAVRGISARGVERNVTKGLRQIPGLTEGER